MNLIPFLLLFLLSLQHAAPCRFDLLPYTVQKTSAGSGEYEILRVARQVVRIQQENHQLLLDEENQKKGFLQNMMTAPEVAALIRAGVVITTRQEGRIEGFVILLPEEDGSLYVEQIGTTRALARQGIGTILLQRTQALGKPITADVRPSNLASQKLFEKMGFRLEIKDDGDYHYSWSPPTT